MSCRSVQEGGQLAFAVAGVYNEANFGSVRAKEEGEMDLTNLALIVPVSLCGSYIQNVTGFGYGIFVMIFFPLLILAIYEVLLRDHAGRLQLSGNRAADAP